MKSSNLWIKAREVNIQTAGNIPGNLDVGFDKRIPDETKNQLRDFVKWVEDNFNLPVKLWVDFEYRHYLIRKDGKRVGYLFYWADFPSYPMFENEEDIPQIRLPVRTEHSSMEEILTSFIEAITDYFAWICNVISEEYEPSEDDVEEILNAYLHRE